MPEQFDKFGRRFLFDDFKGDEHDVQSLLAQNLVPDVRPRDEHHAGTERVLVVSVSIQAFPVHDVANFKKRMLVQGIVVMVDIRAPIMDEERKIVPFQMNGAIV